MTGKSGTALSALGLVLWGECSGTLALSKAACLRLAQANDTDASASVTSLGSGHTESPLTLCLQFSSAGLIWVSVGATADVSMAVLE